MKKIIFIILLMLICSKVSAQEIVNDTVSEKTYQEVVEVASVIQEPKIIVSKNISRYKLYPTPNSYNFIKLDTQTGVMQRVQWNTERNKRFQTYLNSDRLIWDGNEKINGRFEIIMTSNIYNFLLIDTTDGRVWQCQWGFKDKENVVIRIK